MKVKTLIELDFTLSMEEEDKIKKMMELILDRYIDESIIFYDSRFYSIDSEFAMEIFEDIGKEKAAEIEG